MRPLRGGWNGLRQGFPTSHRSIGKLGNGADEILVGRRPARVPTEVIHLAKDAQH
jgi:hypothetical protein